MSPFMLLGGWLVLISLIGIAVTVHDKRAAQKARRRVPERTLLLLATLGGGAAMYLTMHRIHHKTRKAKFMAGIPAILVAELAAAAGVWWLLYH